MEQEEALTFVGCPQLGHGNGGGVGLPVGGLRGEGTGVRVGGVRAHITAEEATGGTWEGIT